MMFQNQSMIPQMTTTPSFEQLEESDSSPMTATLHHKEVRSRSKRVFRLITLNMQPWVSMVIE